MRQQEKKQNKVSVVPRMVPCSSAFTLIEIIVAVSIFTLIITAAMGIFVFSMKGKERVNQLKEIEDNARYTLELMSREIRMAQSIASDEANTSDTEIDFNDSSGISVKFCRANSDGSCNPNGNYLARNTTSNSAITSSKVRISNLTFYVNNFSATVQPRITISMTVEAANNPLVKMDFQTTVSPRIY